MTFPDFFELPAKSAPRLRIVLIPTLYDPQTGQYYEGEPVAWTGYEFELADPLTRWRPRPPRPRPRPDTSEFRIRSWDPPEPKEDR